MNKLILDEIINNAPSYHVWQAVWITELLTRQDYPDRKDFLLDQSGLRFKPYENYEYPPRDIRAVQCKQNEITFTLNFLGLYGVNSPLPRCYHEQIPLQLRSQGENNVPLQSFYDVFNNRFYWLYYQSWKKYRFYLFINENKDHSVTQRIFSFSGKDLNPHIQSELNDFTLLKFSGLFSQRVRNKASLKIILSYLFPNYRINIREFIPKWIELTERPSLGELQTKLGENTFIGETILDYMGRICIDISDIDYNDYKLFIPGNTYVLKIYELLKMFVNDGLEFDLKLNINSTSISSVELDKDAQLGKTTWLGRPQQERVEVYMSFEEMKAAA